MGATIGAAVVVAALVVGEIVGPSPPRGRTTPPEPLGHADGAIHLAGTGTWLPLARALAAAYEEQHPDRSVTVHQSIGSRGGRRAMADGVIDVGLVSHPEGHLPELSCCDVIPTVLAAVVFAVHPSVTETSLRQDQIVDVFSGRMKNWREGQAIVPLYRERRDSSTRIAGKAIPGFTDAVQRARASRQFLTLITDVDMERALVSTTGGVGLFDLGVIVLKRIPLRPLALDGVEPSAATLADRSYPLRRVLSLVVSREPNPATLDFLEFVRSPEGRAIIEDGGGYVALPGETI